MPAPGRHTIAIGRARRTTEKLRGGALQLVTPNGAPVPLSLMLEAIPQGRPGRYLVLGDVEAAVGEALFVLNRPAEVTVHVTDVRDAERATQRISRIYKRGPRPMVVAGAEPPRRTGGYDRVFLVLTDAWSAGELADAVRTAHELTVPGGTFVLSHDSPREGKLKSRVSRAFDAVRAVSDASRAGGTILGLRKAGAASPPPGDETTFGLEIGDDTLTFVTRPGLRSAEGAPIDDLALLGCVDLRGGETLLSLGCDVGVAALAASRLAPLERMVLVDSDLRAAALAAENARTIAPDVASTVLATAHPENDLEEESVDVVLSVPPEEGEHALAETFVQAGYHALRPGGLFTVATASPAWHRKALQRVFGGFVETSGDPLIVLTAAK